MPADRVDRDSRVSSQGRHAVEPRPLVGQGDAQTVRVVAIAETGPRIGPGKPPIVALDAKRLDHPGDQLSLDVARDVRPG